MVKTLPADVVVKLVLKINEAVVIVLGKLDVAEDGTNNEWTNLGSLIDASAFVRALSETRMYITMKHITYIRLNYNLLESSARLNQTVDGNLTQVQKNAQSTGNTFLAK